MRTWLLRLAVSAVVLGLASSASVVRVSACVCSPPDPFRDLREADAAFAGTVLTGADDSGLAEFRVSGVWKGEVGTTELVHVGGDGTSCDFELDEGAEYLVFAYREDSGAPLQIGLCTVTSLPWAEEHLDLDVMGRPQPPGTGPVTPMLPLPEPPGTGAGPHPEESEDEAGTLVLLAGVALALAGIGSVATCCRARRA